MHSHVLPRFPWNVWFCVSSLSNSAILNYNESPVLLASLELSTPIPSHCDDRFSPLPLPSPKPVTPSITNEDVKFSSPTSTVKFLQFLEEWFLLFPICCVLSHLSCHGQLVTASYYGHICTESVKKLFL